MDHAGMRFDSGPPEGAAASGIHRSASIVVLEPDDDLASALLEACDEPVPTSRPIAVRLVPRRAA